MPHPPPLRSQIQDSSEWDALVSEVFRSMDVNGAGSLGHDELELLLCGEDGCEASVCVAVGGGDSRGQGCAPLLLPRTPPPPTRPPARPPPHDRSPTLCQRRCARLTPTTTVL